MPHLLSHHEGTEVIHTINGTTVTIGRADDCGVRLEDASVSNHHAKIIQKGSRHVLKDLDSSNGTTINGLRIAEQVLREGDKVSLGTVELTFRESSHCADTVQPPLPEAGTKPTSSRRRWFTWRYVVGLASLAALVLKQCVFNSTELPLKTQVENALWVNQQEWFDHFHPVGRAKSVEVHDVKEINGPDGHQVVVRFTLHWEGPIVKDGFTKIRATYDFEAQHWINFKVLSTNGITNSEAAEGIGEIVETILR